jgi:hypothetical protein
MLGRYKRRRLVKNTAAQTEGNDEMQFEVAIGVSPGYSACAG